MTEFKILLDRYKSMSENDIASFIDGFAQRAIANSEEYPGLGVIIKSFYAKVAVADKTISDEELDMTLDLINKFAKSGTTKEELQKLFKDNMRRFQYIDSVIDDFTKLPEDIRDDVVMFVTILAGVDGDIPHKESDWLASIAF